MQNTIKVKKSITKDTQNKILVWYYEIYNEEWEKVEIKYNESSYKYKLSNKKEFMKKWTDRRMNIAIKKWLSLLEKEMLFDILDYIDSNNIINFRLLANDFWYSPSKISKARWGLIKKWLIKKVDGIFYLNPIAWIKTKEIQQELIDMFQDSFDRYGVNITL
jgi:hypothetical protein